MIPVRRQPEPAEFDSKVRAKGARILEEHKPLPPVKSAFWRKREYWRDALRDLHSSYQKTCAFAAMRIEWVTGSPTVEHFRPKKFHPKLAYDWDNYRLVCGRMNGRKGDHEDVLDPFEIPAETFDLNPMSGEILVHRNCPQSLRDRALATIERLSLNDNECLEIRKEHRDKAVSGAWSLQEARDQSPFVIECLERQGLLGEPPKGRKRRSA